MYIETEAGIRCALILKHRVLKATVSASFRVPYREFKKHTELAPHIIFKRWKALWPESAYLILNRDVKCRNLYRRRFKSDQPLLLFAGIVSKLEEALRFWFFFHIWNIFRMLKYGSQLYYIKYYIIIYFKFRQLLNTIKIFQILLKN